MRTIITINKEEKIEGCTDCPFCVPVTDDEGDYAYCSLIGMLDSNCLIDNEYSIIRDDKLPNCPIVSIEYKEDKDDRDQV